MELQRGRRVTLADVVEGEHLEAVGLAELAQRVDVAGVAHAEAGVLADDDGHGAQRLDEGAVDELLGRLLGELRA